MTHNFGWQLGHEGKGNYYHDGSISTWNTQDNFPHHLEVANQDGQQAAFHFYISPEGAMHDGEIGFQNRTGLPDNDVVRDITTRTPAVWDGRGQVFDDFQTTPRVEDGYGGYGHAENLIPHWEPAEEPYVAKIAKEEGWADFHTELKLPLSARRKIRKWVDRLRWPEGSSKDDTRRYHITILSMDEYDEDFAKWAKAQMRGKSFHFESTGMDIFADEHVVLRFKSPEWTALVREWTKKAEEEGLEPHVFEPPKAHVTIGKSPSGKWPQGVPDPHVKFDTATFNINKNSAVQWASGDGVCDHCGDVQIGKDSEDGVTTCSNCGGEIPVHGGPHSSAWKIAETTPAEELLSWVQTQTPQEQSTPVSIHHTSPEQLQPQTQAPVVQTPHIDPPKQPYAPYNWADNGFEESPLNMTAASADEEMFVPGMERQPITVIPHTWEETHYGGEPDYAKTAPLEIRTPFLYDDHARAIHLGMPNMIHDDLYEMPSIPYHPERPDGLLNQGELNHMRNPARFNYGNRWEPGVDADEVKTALEDHAGVPFDAPVWHQSAFGTHPCPQCEKPIEGQICQHCGYDPQHSQSDYERAKNEWYDRAWSDPGAQPRPVPGQPMHWGPRDHATDVRFASDIPSWSIPPYLYHWTEAHTAPDVQREAEHIYLTTTGDDPRQNWNVEIHKPYRPHRLTVDTSKLDPHLFQADTESMEGYDPDGGKLDPAAVHPADSLETTGNIFYAGSIPPEAWVDSKEFPRDPQWGMDQDDPRSYGYGPNGEILPDGPQYHFSANESDQQDNAHIADSAPEASPQESPRPSTDADPQGILSIESSVETSIYDVPSQQSDEILWAEKQNGWRLLN